MAAPDRTLPEYVQCEFEEYLRCERCHAEKLVTFSCKRRGFCPSGGARRMAESAVLLVDEALLRGWERARRRR